jgi:hypothetical protein
MPEREIAPKIEIVEFDIIEQLESLPRGPEASSGCWEVLPELKYVNFLFEECHKLKCRGFGTRLSNFS